LLREKSEMIDSPVVSKGFQLKRSGSWADRQEGGVQVSARVRSWGSNIGCRTQKKARGEAYSSFRNFGKDWTTPVRFAAALGAK